MKKLTLGILLFGMLASCSKESDDLTLSSDQGTSTGGERHASPFKATIKGVPDTDPSIPQTLCTGDFPGFSTGDFLLSGIANHVGLINPVSRLHHTSCDLNLTTMQLATVITADIQAPNGDVIHCTGADTIDVTNLVIPGGGSSGAFTGIWTISGGTGRYTGATGSLEVSGLVDFTNLTFSISCDGNITY